MLEAGDAKMLYSASLLQSPVSLSDLKWQHNPFIPSSHSPRATD